MHTAREIAQQYSFDCSDLSCHLQYLRRQIKISDADMKRVNSRLVEHGLEPLQEKQPNPYGHDIPYSAEQAAEMLPAIKAKETEVWRHQYALMGENVKAMAAWSTNTWNDITESFIRFAVPKYPRNLPTDDQVAEVRREVEERAKEIERKGGEEPIDIDLVISVSRYRRKHNETLLLQELWGDVNSLRWAAVSHHPEQGSNVFRQSFILLMTHFDATIFDLVRLALTTNFFALAPKLGRPEKLAYAKLEGHANFDSFRDAIIDDLLKSRYLKELLFELQGLGVIVPDNDLDGGFPRLLEITQRRNIHLHNRGLVDSRYLETGNDGKPRWNLDNLELGAKALIDEQYLKKVSNLCGTYVGLLASWVENGAVPANEGPKTSR